MAHPIGISLMFLVPGQRSHDKKIGVREVCTQDLLSHVCTVTPTPEGFTVDKWKNAIRYMTKYKKEKNELPGKWLDGAISSCFMFLVSRMCFSSGK